MLQNLPIMLIFHTSQEHTISYALKIMLMILMIMLDSLVHIN